jgi:hypothetical protein
MTHTREIERGPLTLLSANTDLVLLKGLSKEKFAVVCRAPWSFRGKPRKTAPVLSAVRQKAQQKGFVMKRLMFAVGALALGLVATAPAHADYAIVKFNSGYCRIYDNTAWAPPDGTFVWFVWGYHRYYRLPTLPIAQHKLGLVIARHLCWHY